MCVVVRLAPASQVVLCASVATNIMATKLYSMAEVAQHNDNKKSWIVVHNGVYDVTEFLNEHPGGEEVLLEQAGKDATEPFEDVGHSSDARELMAKYKVGELIESERKKIKEPAAKDWSADNNSEDSSSWKSWLIPVTLGILATIVYRFLTAQ
ncbi:hypothetical protein FOCC_FOCC010714 [Frankliniella occidentalis]|nr:hypothetical protein FOCC_FOCC010714 [Frankliniella occidentalis]